MSAAPPNSSTEPRFSDLLERAMRVWDQRKADDGVFGLAVPLRGLDPLLQLADLEDADPFRFLWDGAPGLCLAAAGRCHHLELSGPRRFELAQRFSDITLGRILEGTPEAPAQARSRILLAFSFFEQSGELQPQGSMPSVQAVLPRWQLSRHGRHGWLRLHGIAQEASDVRSLVESLWLMAEKLQSWRSWPGQTSGNLSGRITPGDWERRYTSALQRGLELVNGGELHKLVLAVRHSVSLTSPLDPLLLLKRLRHQQAGSCRFLWQRNRQDSFFGASPERLLSLRNGQLRCDALAGTAGRNDHATSLLNSDKDRREHELVVQAITEHLSAQGLKPRRPRSPQLARHGQLIHLHTPITTPAPGQSPLALAGVLHPTPAVAGLPRREAMSWLRSLEPFDRDGYAAPIGWIDSAGDAELRVAIRCGHARGAQLDLTAGAGLVRGSVAERELQEVGLKLTVLADQLDLVSGGR
ncbi:MAG: isochorismate synthase [Cyanobium sp. ARS6]|uniref:isochorismate synthase n=1 Tax=Synechococcus sp. MIT S9507 TaxID=3082544 RepID=UPI000C39CBB8|nr:isochorismate synthase [Cyanobium sp. ARS6]